jgi:hypothetical protein
LEPKLRREQPVTTVAGGHQLFYLWTMVFDCFRQLFPSGNLSFVGGSHHEKNITAGVIALCLLRSTTLADDFVSDAALGADSESINPLW